VRHVRDTMRRMSDREYWVAFAQQMRLAILADLDGTLIPFAASPELARPEPELVAFVSELARAPGVNVVVVSGRAHETLQDFFADPAVLLVGEHGGWRRESGVWEPTIEVEQREVDGLTEELRRVAARAQGAAVERKTWSVAFHLRGVEARGRDGAAVEVENRIGAWLAAHPLFEELRGAEVLEVRPARMTKASAIPWVRAIAGHRARVLSLGDDLTDEDTFRALEPEDAAIRVGADEGRATTAAWSLTSPEEVNAFLRWLLAARKNASTAPPLLPRRLAAAASTPAARGSSPFRLLVVSNRLPELRSAADSFETRGKNVSGLVSALEPALRARNGVWLGWSGRVLAGADATRFGLDEALHPRLAAVDLPEEWFRQYYNGLCNGALWPLLHTFPGRASFADDEWVAYQKANDAFAVAASRLVGPADTVWLHDYHLFLVGQKLRERGHTGPLGLFLHVPFPGPDVFFLLPWAEEMLAALLSLDLLGFHTAEYAANFRHCVARLPGVRCEGGVVAHHGRRTQIGAFPIGILPEQFQEAPAPAAADEVAGLMKAIAPSRLVLGVDRLDYTKGIPERLIAFARLLALRPEWRRKVSLVQISVPSRADVPAYAEQRERVEQIVGRTNGEFGEADWVPVRYLYRSYRRDQLSLLYRAAAVGYVTPLRDGMNLVAKEYVAAQDPEDPGVLVLSRFAGAAAELDGAVLTNPWHADGLARDLDRALRMDLEERRARHRKLLAIVSRTTALTWAEDFLSALASAAAANAPAVAAR